jgi:hypothetical protein
MGSHEASQAAAAILVLLEGSQVPLLPLLQPIADKRALAEFDRALRQGSREARARALAATLTRLALDLDRWSIA